MRNIGDIISSNRKKLKLSQPMLAELLQQELTLQQKQSPNGRLMLLNPVWQPSLQYAKY